MVESFRGLRKFFNTKSSDAARAKSAKGAKFWIIVHFLCVLRVLCARCPIFGCGFAVLGSSCRHALSRKQQSEAVQ
jgi:hypothetical protein